MLSTSTLLNILLDVVVLVSSLLLGRIDAKVYSFASFLHSLYICECLYLHTYHTANNTQSWWGILVIREKESTQIIDIEKAQEASLELVYTCHPSSAEKELLNT